MRNTIFGRTKGEIVYIPIQSSPYLRTVVFSTREKDVVVDGIPFVTDKNLDYVATPIIANGNLFNKYYSPNFEGDVPILLKGGKSDVFSIFISQRYASGSYRHWLNIQNFGAWIGQFPNIYSFLIDTGVQGVDTDIIKGDLSQIPDSLEMFEISTARVINRTTDIFLNISNFSPNSKLKYFNIQEVSKFSGDLKFIPQMCSFFRLRDTQSGNSISYSGGKVWASAFDTLYLPIALTITETNGLLNDMGNSIVSAIGAKVINIQSQFILQDAISKVNYLQSLGFAVTSGLDTTSGTATSTTVKLIMDVGILADKQITYFKVLGCAVGSAITYTAGKVWASAFDTLYLPLALTLYENDNLLIDMANSITSAVGGKVIYLGGVGSYRSSASDSAVTYLTGLGFTISGVTKIVPLKILDLPLQNSFADSGEIGMTMVAGGTSNQPTFALSGRKAGEYCAVFNGSQSIKTTTNLPINSDKVTIAFWIKTAQTAVAIITELSTNTNTNNAFSCYINDSVPNSIQFNSRNTGVNQSARAGANNGTWKHFVAVIDRAQNGANEILIYENGGLISYTKPASTDNNGNFVNNILFIGQRAGSSVGFNGMLTKLKLYNYPFTPSEVSTLYNSEL